MSFCIKCVYILFIVPSSFHPPISCVIFAGISKKNAKDAKLERDCGLANATIRRWEIASPTVDNLTKVADYFGVSIDFLIGRDTYSMSETAQEYARQFDELPEEKKQLAMAYMGVVKAQ